MTPIRLTIVTLSVSGPCADWLAPWMWTVDGPGPGTPVTGFATTEAEAWGDARHHATTITARLETPAGGHDLHAAVNPPPRTP